MKYFSITPESKSLSELFAEFMGYESFDDFSRAKRIEHNEQLDILADVGLSREIIDLFREELDTEESRSQDRTVKHMIDVSKPKGIQSQAEMFGHLTGHDSRVTTVEGMVGMGISAQKHDGAYVTPQRVVDLMLELAMPMPEESVYDPCFGYGGLLVEAAYRQNAGAMSSSSNTSSDTRKTRIFGVERDLLPYSAALCRLMLADVDHSGLVFDDALNPRAPLPRAGAEAGFDCILAAPPWGRSVESSGAFPAPGESTEHQFVRHVMDNLAPGGRAVVALPEEPLFRDEDRPLRKALLSDYRVDGVISLPAGALEPCTSLPMNLLVFSRAPRHETVRFARFSREAWDMISSNDDDSVRQDEPRRSPDERAAHSTELMRSLSALIRHRQATTSEVLPSGVQVWDVPICELEIRDHELIAKKSGSEELDTELKRLLETEPSLKIDTLGRLAEVWGGVSYEPRFRVRPGDRSDVVAGLVYPGDITDHGIRPPKWFLSPEGSASVKEEAYLRSGDFVVTTSGSVGNIGLVDDSMSTIRMLPTTGLAQIRARSGIDSRFLAAILRSPVYGAWLSGHVREPTPSIRHLRLRELRGLKIPVPPLSTQEAVIEELRGRWADALAVLARLMAVTSKSPIASWLETPVVARLAAGSTVDSAGGMDTLVEVAQGIQSLAVSESSDSLIRAWLEAARKAAAALDGVDSIPPGAGRLATLEFALVRLHEALAALGDAEGHVAGRLSSVTRGLVELVEHEVYMMQRSITLDLDVEPVEVVAGDASEVIVRATNASEVPLRNVRLRAWRPDGTTEERAADYVAERGTHDLPVAVRPTGAERSLQIAVEWRARRFDGTLVRGDGAVSLLVRENGARYRAGAEEEDLGYSPYQVGNPEVRDGMFFGREGTMERIRRQLGGDHANVVLLEGNRRTGKTSILQRLEKVETPPGWIPVYCSFQDADSVATADVFRLFARRTGEALADAGIETWVPDWPRPDSPQPFKITFRNALSAFSAGHPFETLEVYLAGAIEAAKPRRILFMIDEFDKLQEGIDSGITSPQVPENIRHLLQHQPGLGAIITGSRRLKRLREEYWSALFGFGHRIGVSALPTDDARRLVTEPVAGRLRYLPQACVRLVELCACHPFLIQSLCNRVFEQAATGSDRTITVEIVERAAREMVRDNEHFQTLWGYAGSERRRLILALCDRLEAAGVDAVNVDLLSVKFHEHEVLIRRATDLVDDIAKLRELELVDFDESYRGGTYQLSTPLMAMWLKKNVNFDDLVVRARQEAQDAT